MNNESFRAIARRYFVLNGFDGVLTVLGITAGSFATDVSNPMVLISSGIGAAVALGMSGVSGAYITEKAERLKQFKELQNAMLDEMESSVHKRNVHRRSIAISVINGLSPFICAVTGVLPFWGTLMGLFNMTTAYYSSASISLALMAFLGGFLGKISRESIPIYALKMVGVGVATAFLTSLLGVGS